MPSQAHDRIARRAAKELGDRPVDLGVEIAVLVARLISASAGIVLRSEAGLLGIGPFAAADDLDAYLAAAHREGDAGAISSSAETFRMLQGDPIELAIVGAMPLGERAMGLVARAKRVVVAMQHTTADGTPRLPRDWQGVARRIVTELAVIDVTPEGLLLREVAPNVSAREVQEVTDPTLNVPPDLSTMVV